jgi:hypothetical protein
MLRLGECSDVPISDVSGANPHLLGYVRCWYVSGHGKQN